MAGPSPAVAVTKTHVTKRYGPQAGQARPSQNLEILAGTSNHSFRSFFTLPDAIWTRCCSVTGSASSHCRPGSFIT
jgi:hypothetical protein